MVPCTEHHRVASTMPAFQKGAAAPAKARELGSNLSLERICPGSYAFIKRFAASKRAGSLAVTFCSARANRDAAASFSPWFLSLRRLDCKNYTTNRALALPAIDVLGFSLACLQACLPAVCGFSHSQEQLIIATAAAAILRACRCRRR
jgi:hypothetical protein